jgi:hypothetical protein
MLTDTDSSQNAQVVAATYLLTISILLYISYPIGNFIQCHIIFLIIWRRERKVRERCACFTKQLLIFNYMQYNCLFPADDVDK